MSQSVLLKVAGLYTFQNHLSAVPAGGLLKATNIFINRDSIAESRRGFKVYSNVAASSAHQLLMYKDTLFRHYGPGAGTLLEYDSDGLGTFLPFKFTFTGNISNGSPTVTNLSTTSDMFVGMFVSGTGIPAATTILSITNNTTIVLSQNATATTVGVTLTFIYKISETETGLRIKYIEQNGNFYFTTSEGIKKISTTSSSVFSSTKITNAGGVKALDLNGSINASAGFLSANSVVAYRLIWGINDANDNLIIGTPSERFVIRNTTGTAKQVDIVATIPRSITTNYFYQLYRSDVVADATGDVDPGDELQLVYEANPTSVEITAKYVTTTDNTPDDLKGTDLYTNANSGGGILQANDIPPLAKDIATFKNYTFYANTLTRQRLTINLLSVSNLTNNVSTITVTDGTSTTYTFRDAASGGEDIPNKKILLAGLPDYATPSQQVDATARSMVRVINGQASEIINAFYISGIDQIPGQMLLENIVLNEASFHLTVNSTATGNQFSPNIPTSGTTVISNNEISPNRIYYSKVQQPEAVPIVNYIDVGPKDKEIIRIIGLRDSLFILKEEGVYRLSGTSEPFQVYPFDFSTNIKCADSAVVLNNLIYLMTNQGVATISDSQVSIISRPIEDQILPLLTSRFTNFDTATFGVNYESDRSYYLFTVTSASDTVATQCFRFNTFTNSWTKLDLTKRCALVSTFDDKLYLGATDINYIEQERKTLDRTDFADREHILTIDTDAVNNTEIRFSDVSNMSVGDILVQTQYLTIRQFNRLLTKLDNDATLTHTYNATLEASEGVDLSDQLDSLLSQIGNDPLRLSQGGAAGSGSYTSLGPTPSTFSGMQSTFNSLVALLNLDAGVQFSNYRTSTGTVDYEFPILELETQTQTATINYVYPLIIGPITLYNHIDTEIQFVPQIFTDPSMSKQVSEGTFIFEDSGFTNATISYSSDASADFEDTIISGNGPGTFGNFTYGQGIYGGNGAGFPFRTYIPRNKQFCRYMNCKFTHMFAREIFSLYGISLTFRPISSRAYK